MTNNFAFTKLVFLFSFFIGCYSVKTVDFKVPVDTTTKKISRQIKQIYALKDIGIYASNNFDAARLNGFETVNDSTVRAIIRPENKPINNSAYYSFQIWSQNPKTIYIEFDYPQEFEHRYIPKTRQENTTWSAIDSSKVYKTDKQVLVRLNVTKDTTWVSAQEVVTSKDTEKWYKSLIKNKPYVRLKSVGKTILGRNIPVLDIYRGSKQQKSIVVLLTRQHPPEVTGFFAYQEFLKSILEEKGLTHKFLNRYRVLAFPIVNPDGVDLGHWRHNAGGVDTNRDWSKYRQPEIKQIVKFISQQSKKCNSKIVLGLDFHSTYEDVFYTNEIRETTALPHFIDSWFAALEANIPHYKVNEKIANSTKPVSKGWFLYGQNAVGITYEIGDATPRDTIKIVGKATAEEMMKILISYPSKIP